MHRRPEFRASPDSVNKMFALHEEKKLGFQIGQVARLEGADGKLQAAIVKGPEGEVRLPCTRLLPFFGLTMKLGPVAEWGLNLHENRIEVDHGAVRDLGARHLRHRRHQLLSGKLKLILCGFHEAALMAQAAKQIVHPNERVVFQYTTSSTSLQKKLGVV